VVHFKFDDYFSPGNDKTTRHEVISYCCRDGVAGWYITKPSPEGGRAYESAVLAYLAAYGAGIRRKPVDFVLAPG